MDTQIFKNIEFENYNNPVSVNTVTEDGSFVDLPFALDELCLELCEPHKAAFLKLALTDHVVCL